MTRIAKKLTCKDSDGAKLNSFENASWRDLLDLMEVKVVMHCGNPNSAGNKGGAPVGNTNSSTRENNISNLFEEGCAFDRHSDDIIALFSLRKSIEHEPLHANSNYCIGRLPAHKLFQGGDFITSSSSELQIVEGANQRRLVSSNF